MTITSGECLFVILLIAAFIGLWRGWMREVITMAILLAVVLFLSTTGNQVLYRFVFINLADAFRALFAGGNSVSVASSAPPPQNADDDILFILSTFTILTGISYLVGHKAGRPASANSHRVIGIIPGLFNGIVITSYTVSHIIPKLQVSVEGPNQSSVSSYLPIIFGVGLVALVGILIALTLKPKPKK